MTEQFVFGTRETAKLLERFGQRVSNKMLSQSVRAAMVPMRDAARANAPKGEDVHKTYKGRKVPPGFLKENIKLRKRRSKNKFVVEYTLQATGEAWYGKLIETGYRPTKRSKRVKSTSRKIRGALSISRLRRLGDRRTSVPGRPWLGPALKTHGPQTQQRLEKELLKRIQRALR